MSKIKLMTVTKNDFEIQTFRSGGKGGQNQNKIESGVRIIHKESGVVTESREERSQFENKKIAFKRMSKHPKFLKWLRLESLRRNQLITSDSEIKQKVNEMLREENLKIEFYDTTLQKYVIENNKK